jgi:hypothetical protein
MKTMTCKQLAGACDQEFQARTFDEMAEMSRSHAIEMTGKGDRGHIEKMEEMKALMSKPGAMEEWFANVRKEFEALPETNGRG